MVDMEDEEMEEVMDKEGQKENSENEGEENRWARVGNRRRWERRQKGINCFISKEIKEIFRNELLL